MTVRSRLNVTHVSEDVAAQDVSSSEAVHCRVTVLLDLESNQDVAQLTWFPRNGGGCFRCKLSDILDRI